MLVAQVPHVPRVVLQNEIRNKPPQVPQEPFGDLSGSHHTARQGRQVRKKIVPAAIPEYLAESRRPVL